jgi:hypothetical protein
MLWIAGCTLIYYTWSYSMHYVQCCNAQHTHIGYSPKLFLKFIQLIIRL